MKTPLNASEHLVLSNVIFGVSILMIPVPDNRYFNTIQVKPIQKWAGPNTTLDFDSANKVEYARSTCVFLPHHCSVPAEMFSKAGMNANK